MARTRAIAATSSLVVNSLIGPNAWSGDPTWALAPTAPHGGVYGENFPTRPSPILHDALHDAVRQIESFTRLDLNAVGPHGGAMADIRIFQSDTLELRTADGMETIRLGAYTIMPGGGAAAGDVWIGGDIARGALPGSYAYRVVLHEFAHALGLKHPDDPGYARLPASLDGAEYSVMSTRAYPGASPADGLGIEPGGYAETYMTYDIAALQYLYGANYRDTADDRYVFDPTDRVVQRTIWDGGGIDTYDFSRFINPLEIDLRPGHASTTGQEAHLNRSETPTFETETIRAGGAIHNAFLYRGKWRSAIENAIGGREDDTITGNRLANSLIGRSGDDTLFGGEGRDTLDGGTGRDDLRGEGGHDRLHGRQGADTLMGDAGADTLDGASGADVLNGGQGPDRLLGGPNGDRLFGGQGADSLDGGTGADRLAGNAGADRLFGGDGDDTIDGGPGGDALFGEQGADRLFGGSDADTLLGGFGDDTMTGGPGPDLFRFTGHTGADTITDFAPGADRLDVADPAAAFASAFAAGADTIVYVSGTGDSVRLLGISPGALSPDDFA
ncbi:M10 family metallopeptidase C-terminal domain-containing protein [Acuticoccus sp. M5D2P5]|uniref:M10 family metallopeptidase n=1 Tax=Acuticoccus kalidii TaxID=2910977 RepID=UPI001F2E53C0|nr:M10 family metallopeptidase [Acuticoccus kalidii]MCF3936573.1 M10 family metallopeptidase C-terminal domain-containing protein [Acuticoccus kalidii]